VAAAKNGDTVKVHYTGKLEDGTEFDSSTGREPLQFTVGEHEVIPGFEEAVVGMNQSESKTVKVLADAAYGPRFDEMMLKVDRSRLPQDFEPQVGQQLQMKRSDGRTIIVTVSEVSESDVTLDANHPLAGKDLIFDIELVEIIG